MTSKLDISFDDLYDSCLFSSLFHAIGNLRYPYVAYAESWDGVNYSCQEDLARGTVSFDLDNRIAVGAMRNDISPRVRLYPAFESIDLFAQAPEAVRELAWNEALQYLFKEVGGVTKPVATTALWCFNEQMTVYNDYEDFRDNGGEFLCEILIPKDELRDYCNDAFEYSPDELELADLLFELAKKRSFDISENLIAFVDRKAKGFNEFIEWLSQIGFKFQ